MQVAFPSWDTYLNTDNVLHRANFWGPSSSCLYPEKSDDNGFVVGEFPSETMFIPRIFEEKATSKGNYIRRNGTRTFCISQHGVKVLPRYLSDGTPSCHDFCKYGMKHILEKKAKSSSPRKFQVKPGSDQESLEKINLESEKETSTTSVNSKPQTSENEASTRANSHTESSKSVKGGYRRSYSEVLLQTPDGNNRRLSCLCTSKELAAFRNRKSSDLFPPPMKRRLPQDVPEKTLYVIETRQNKGRSNRSKPSRSPSQTSTERSFKGSQKSGLPIRPPSSTSSSSSYGRRIPIHSRHEASNAPSSSSSSVSLFSRPSTPTPSESISSGSVSKRTVKKPNSQIPKERFNLPVKVEKGVATCKDGSPRKPNSRRGKLAQVQAVNPNPRSPKMNQRKELDENQSGKSVSRASSTRPSSSSSTSLLSSSSPPHASGSITKQSVVGQENQLPNTKLKRIVVTRRVERLITEDKVVSPQKLKGKAVGIQSKTTSPRSPRSPRISQRKALGEKQIGKVSNGSPMSRTSSSSSVSAFTRSPKSRPVSKGGAYKQENRLANQKQEKTLQGIVTEHKVIEKVVVESKNSRPRNPRMQQRRGLGENQNSKFDTNRRALRKAGAATKSVVSEARTPKVVLRHQHLEEGRRIEQSLLNNVIEETASKLAEARKSKVKALVGAFETVISLHDTRSMETTTAA